MEMKNRFIKTATYEGMSRKGEPEQRLYDLHAQMAANDVALTTVAYGAVNEDGLTHEEQMVIDDSATPHLKKLAKAVHDSGGKVSLQLTHCGYFTRSSRFQSRRPFAPSVTLNKYGLMRGRPWSRSMSRVDIDRTIADFARAAGLAQLAGFDAVEVHMGHGYLLSQFLSPAVNKRNDEYGGSIENRARMALEVVRAIRMNTGEDFPIFSKLNLSDDLEQGFSLNDCIKTVQMLERNGVDAVTLSGGFTSLTPYFLMRGEVPLKEMVESERNCLQKLALRFFGRQIIKKYEFEENFFLEMARKVRKRTYMPLVYVGGVVSAQGIHRIMEEGFDMIALGRALIAEPDFLRKVRADSTHISPCDQCNKCVGYMEKTGIRCVL